MKKGGLSAFLFDVCDMGLILVRSKCLYKKKFLFFDVGFLKRAQSC